MFRYRCGQCRTTSLPVATRAELLAERDQHRRRKHGGHVPDGERLLQRSRRPTPVGSVRPAVVLILILAVVLLSLITRR